MRFNLLRTLMAGIILLLGGLALPSSAYAAPMSIAACTDPPSGPNEYRVVNRFDYRTGCGGYSRTVLRAGNTTYGELHIDLGGYSRNEANHELTQYAKDLWAKALLNRPLTEQDGFYRYSHYYLTPGGEQRTMCVMVDTKSYGGYGERGITTAFWVRGIYDCRQEK